MSHHASSFSLALHFKCQIFGARRQIIYSQRVFEVRYRLCYSLRVHLARLHLFCKCFWQHHNVCLHENLMHRLDILLGQTHPQCIVTQRPIIRLQGSTDTPQCLDNSIGFLRDRLRCTLALKQTLLFVTLSNIYLASAFTLRLKNLRSFHTLSFRLQLHASLDLCRRLNIFNLMA